MISNLKPVPITATFNGGTLTTTVQVNPIPTFIITQASMKVTIKTGVGCNSTGGGGGGGTTSMSSTCQLTIKTVGKGSVTTSPSGTAFAPGTKVALAAPPDAGQPWIGWSADDDQGHPDQLQIVRSDCQLKARRPVAESPRRAVRNLSGLNYFSSSSATWTALSAAPFHRLSPLTQRARPLSKAVSMRMRPTPHFTLRVKSSGVG